MNQHDLMIAVLGASGGIPIETLVPKGQPGRIADMLFPDDNVIAEVKSLENDRAADPAILAAVADYFARNEHRGAPKIRETTVIRMHDLEPEIGIGTMRILAQRPIDVTKTANKQIKATKTALGRPDALGMLVIITPPFALDRNSIIWGVRDATRNDHCRSIDLLFLVETPLGREVDPGPAPPSFLSFHPRSEGQLVPERLEARLHQGWQTVTGQPGRLVDVDDFPKFGATS